MNSHHENNGDIDHKKLINFRTVDHKQYCYSMIHNQDCVSFNIYDNDPHRWIGSLDVFPDKYTYYGRGFSGGCANARLDPTNRDMIVELAVKLMTFC